MNNFIEINGAENSIKAKYIIIYNERLILGQK